MTTSNEGRDRGRKRGERGIKRAAHNHDFEINRDTVPFIDRLLSTGFATTDDSISDLDAKYSDGGQWRANIPRRCQAAGFIAAAGVVKSTRPARHAGYVTRWKLIDRPAAERYRENLLKLLRKDAGESGGTDLPAVYR